MIDNHFINIFNARFDYLWSLFNATSPISHRGEKGNLRETFVRQIIESILPNHFGLGSGVVTDFNGRESSQADIIVYDRRLMLPIFQDLGRGIYPIDSVIRVLEIKSVLDNAALKDARAAAWKLSPQNPNGLKLARSGKLPNSQANYPLFGIFAYESKVADITKLIESFQDNKHQPMMAVLGRGLVLKGTSKLIKLGNNAETVRCFMACYLHYIEEEATSRGDFGLLEWLGKNFRS
ncbi:DUF6602 domain-containing protein [Achromobacter kerstersii]|uniref:DUF6602 domain-containing protein n=1 Tax=Achromobacter kerstersii TaxID=1353890 RepID=A0A6S6Z9M5_9BURK|nr:DUF6602 domain-containing protein [Achromobacter kerstersii]CAB3662619.1 hypothetical protein LMG3441_00640 [Achromobacter kerstersii]